MSKMKVIVLRGSQNTGKTGTIRKAAVLFGKKHRVVSDPLPVEKCYKGSADILCTFSIAPGVKVGFVSFGDDPITEYLEQLATKNCKVIVCAISVENASIETELRKWCVSKIAKLTLIDHPKIELCNENGKNFPKHAAQVLIGEIAPKRNKLMASLINWYVSVEIVHREVDE